MNRLERKVLTQLAKDFYRPAGAAEIAREIQLPQDQVQAALTRLIKQSILELYQGDYYLRPDADIIAGHYQGHVQGYGFVHTSGDSQYYVGPGKSRGARDGDILLCEVLARQPGKAPMVKVRDFLWRSPRLVAAKFSGGTGLGNVQDGNRKIMIPTRAAAGAQDGDCVLVSINGWEGQVVAVLEEDSCGRIDLYDIAAQKGIVPIFPPAVEQEVDQLDGTISSEDWQGRLDLRAGDVVTVDGEDSLELDDGFSLTQVQGNWRLGLHIADAAHYVTPGSALDREAMQRALSVYLLDREIPMLPPRLSQQICSLVPGSPRLALSCLVELSPQGEVLSYKFAETVINSRQRLTYTQVDQGDCGEWNELVSAAKEVQQLLYQRRRQRGAAYIDLPATEIDLDTQGRPVSMAARQSAGGRELVEEFMILINELAADYLHKRSISFLHRGNEGFHPGRIEDINGFLSRWGHKLDSPAVQDLQGLLDAINQRPEQLPISRKLARGLRKSRYSVKPLPHYNMALDRYTHISSPIRRYSDLFIHRLVKHAIRDENTKELERDLPRIAQRCSFKEQLAGDVERECLELKKLQYLEQSELEYLALVVEQTGSGPLVWLENAAEGIVVAGAPREKLSGYVPGEKVKVKVHKLDYNAKRIYFSLME